MSNKDKIRRLQIHLSQNAISKKRDWWEKYMKHVIKFRGIGIPDIRRLVADWYREERLDLLAQDLRLQLATDLFLESFAEDKLAAIILLQDYLIDGVDWQQLHENLEHLFLKKAVFDWNTCDWLCVRVTGPLIENHGESCAQAFLAWKSADNLWQARASVVSFVYLVKPETYHQDVLEACSVLLKREERFAKTAVGWVLREISRTAPATTHKFVTGHLHDFSLESLKNALKYLQQDTRTEIIGLYKSSN